MNTIVTEKLRYTTVAIALHWAIAALIIFNLGLGFFMEGLAPELKRIIIPLHISSGITVLVLTVLRIVWRLTHRPPPFLAGLAAWERSAAHAVHGLLYVLMLAMPLTGWALVSANQPRPDGGGIMLWSAIPWPAITALSRLEVSVQKPVHDSFVTAHNVGAWIMLSLLVLHVAAALKHQFVDRQAELARMGIGATAAGRQ
jgi:cytochrome b561